MQLFDESGRLIRLGNKLGEGGEGKVYRAVSIGHDDTMLRDQLIEDLDRFPPA
jgi:RIO-like serine/threonine protein kinase